MKYYNYQITTSEIPDEITLCINLTNCPIHCADCHSKFLWEDIGEELTKEKLFEILDNNKGISCVCVMGGDADYKGLAQIFSYVFVWCYQNRTNYMTALYSGRQDVQDLLDRAGVWIKAIDYIKVGPYIKDLGPINVKTTNQRLYKQSIMGDILAKVDGADIRGWDFTKKFWK